MKMNKLCSNLDQSNPAAGGFTDDEKRTMRNNIGASQISYNSTVTDMTVTKEVVRPYMNTKYSATVGSDSFLLLPSTFADGMVVKSNGSLQTQSIPTVKNTHYIIYTGSPSLTDDKYTELTTAVSNDEPVVIVYGQGSTSSYFTLTTYGANGYDFTGYSVANNQIMSLHVALDKSVTLSTNSVDIPKITTYNASFSTWTRMRQLDSSISSGAIFADNTLSTPIQLSAGKKYLISPIGLMGNVEQTKTLSEGTNVAYSIRIWLWDSSKTMLNGDTAVIIGEAEIANHNTATLGQYPPVNGTYHGSFAPTDAIITPTQDLSLNTLRVSNGGNIDFGFDSSHPAILVMDHRIVGINVMEIQ